MAISEEPPIEGTPQRLVFDLSTIRNVGIIVVVGDTEQLFRLETFEMNQIVRGRTKLYDEITMTWKGRSE